MGYEIGKVVKNGFSTEMIQTITRITKKALINFRRSGKKRHWRN